MGKVILAGAGPGDMGLLTLKAYKYIREADCLVYDRLMSPKLLELARTGITGLSRGIDDVFYLEEDED